MRVQRSAVRGAPSLGAAALVLALAACKPKPSDDRPLPSDPVAAGRLVQAELDLEKGGAKPGERLRAPNVVLDAENVTINRYRVAARRALSAGGQAPAREDATFAWAHGLKEHWKIIHPSEAFASQADVVLPADATFVEGASLVQTLAAAGYADRLTVHAGDATATIDVAVPDAPPIPDAPPPNTVLQICNTDGWQARLRWASPRPFGSVDVDGAWGHEVGLGRDDDIGQRGPWRPVSPDTVGAAVASLCKNAALRVNGCERVDVAGGASSFRDALALVAGAGRAPNGSLHSPVSFGACAPAGGPTVLSPAALMGIPESELPRLDEGDITVEGRFAAVVVRMVMSVHLARLRYCYERGLSLDPSLSGRVTVRLTIDEAGAVTSVANAGSDMSDKDVLACSLAVFRAMTFPPPASGTAAVTYPLIFSPPAWPPPSPSPVPSRSGVGLGGNDAR